MTQTDRLHPASPDEVVETLSFALRYDGRKRVHHADTILGRIVAERLVRHLEASGFVVMKGRDGAAPEMPMPRGTSRQETD